MIVEELTSLESLHALAPAWSALADRCADATPFQRPEWLLPWCARFANPHEIWAIAIFSGLELVALAPFASRAGTLSLLGEGITDYLDLLVDPAHRSAALAALAAHLEARPDRARACDLRALRGTSPLLTIPFPFASRDTIAPDDACPVLALPGRPAELFEVIPRAMLRNVRKATARAERLGRFACVTADAANRSAILEAFLALHAARWTAAGEPGVLADPRVQSFHREVSAAFCARGDLRLHAVTLDDRVAGVVYGFAAHGTVYLYLQGYDPDLAEIGPGTLAVANAVESAAREGARAVDFLRGQERYKHLWGAAPVRTFRRAVAI